MGIRARREGAVSNAIADSARSKGAVIRTNALVQKIIVRDGRARGVVLATGEEISAKLVASNLDPKKLFSASSTRTISIRNSWTASANSVPKAPHSR